MAEWKSVSFEDGVDTKIATHAGNVSAHHTKYTDVEAVAAVATADDYVKNTGDTCTGDLYADLAADTTRIVGISGFAVGKTGIFRFADGYNQLEITHGGMMTIKGYHGLDVIANGASMTSVCKLGTMSSLLSTFYGQIDLSSLALKNPKNHAASALSGTKKVVEIDIGGTPYYFEVYPTKA